MEPTSPDPKVASCPTCGVLGEAVEVAGGFQFIELACFCDIPDSVSFEDSGLDVLLSSLPDA